MSADGLSMDDLEIECACGQHMNLLMYARDPDRVAIERAKFRRHHPDGKASIHQPRKVHRILAPEEQTVRRAVI